MAAKTKKFPIPKVVKQMAEKEAAKHRVLKKDDELKAQRSAIVRPGATLPKDMKLEPGSSVPVVGQLTVPEVEAYALELPASKLGDLFVKKVSSVLSQEKVEPPVLLETFDAVKAFADGWESMEKMARNRTLETIQKLGKQKEDSDTLVLDAGPYEIEARSRGTPVDEKKLEALIRAKGKDPSLLMQATVVYKVDNAKLDWAIGANILTKAEVDACRREMAYNVMRPKRKGA